MNNIISIFQDTLKKEIRNKALLIIFILNILLITIVNSFVDFFVTMLESNNSFIDIQQQKVFIFMFVVNKWTGVLSILFGVSCIKSDDEEGVLGQIISLPISRTQYLIGRILGATVIVVSFYLILSLFSGVIVTMENGSWPFLPTYILAIVPSLISIMSVIMLSIFISLILGKLMSFLLCCGTLLLINVSGALYENTKMTELFTDLGLLKVINLVTYLFFPHIKSIDNITEDLAFGTENSLNYLFEFSHAFVSMGLLYLILIFILKRKEV